MTINPQSTLENTREFNINAFTLKITKSTILNSQQFDAYFIFSLSLMTKNWNSTNLESVHQILRSKAYILNRIECI